MPHCCRMAVMLRTTSGSPATRLTATQFCADFRDTRHSPSSPAPSREQTGSTAQSSMRLFHVSAGLLSAGAALSVMALSATSDQNWRSVPFSGAAKPSFGWIDCSTSSRWGARSASVNGLTPGMTIFTSRLMPSAVVSTASTMARWQSRSMKRSFFAGRMSRQVENFARSASKVVTFFSCVSSRGTPTSGARSNLWRCHDAFFEFPAVLTCSTHMPLAMKASMTVIHSLSAREIMPAFSGSTSSSSSTPASSRTFRSRL
mmetsp:Transcript_5722/g.15428  ORF Transcript_5722/g.15428 Transcript_5722/m.15428 type:complete len:259 (+) Transcript_5722:1015-1791(+)